MPHLEGSSDHPGSHRPDHDAGRFRAIPDDLVPRSTSGSLRSMAGKVAKDIHELKEKTAKDIHELKEKAKELIINDPLEGLRSPIGELREWGELLPAHIAQHRFQELRDIVNVGAHEQYDSSHVQYRMVASLQKGLITNREKNSRHIVKEMERLGFQQMTQGEVKEVYDYLVRNPAMTLQRDTYIMLKSLSDRTATVNEASQFIYQWTEIEAWKQRLSVSGLAGPASLVEMLQKREALRISAPAAFQEHLKQVRSQAAMEEFKFIEARFREISPEPLSPVEIAVLDPISTRGRQFIRIDKKMLFQHVTEERVEALKASSIFLFVRQADHHLKPLVTSADDAVKKVRTQVLHVDAHISTHVDTMPPPQREPLDHLPNLYENTQSLPIHFTELGDGALERQWEGDLTQRERALFPEIVRLQQQMEQGGWEEKGKILKDFHQEFLLHKEDTIIAITDRLHDAGVQFMGNNISAEQVRTMYTYYFENRGLIFQPKTYMMVQGMCRDKTTVGDVANVVQSLKEVREWEKAEFNYLGVGIGGSLAERIRWHNNFDEHYRNILSDALLEKYRYLAHELNKDFESRGIPTQVSALEVAAIDPLTPEGRMFITIGTVTLYEHPDYAQWARRGDQSLPSSSQGGSSLNLTYKDVIRFLKVTPFQRGRK